MTDHLRRLAEDVCLRMGFRPEHPRVWAAAVALIASQLRVTHEVLGTIPEDRRQ